MEVESYLRAGGNTELGEEGAAHLEEIVPHVRVVALGMVAGDPNILVHAAMTTTGILRQTCWVNLLTQRVSQSGNGAAVAHTNDVLAYSIGSSLARALT